MDTPSAHRSSRLSDRDRRIVGGWVLLLVLSGLVVGSALGAPEVPGRAERAAPEPPPAVGSCVRTLADLELVPCTEDHLGEVVAAWPGRVPAVPLDPAQYPPTDFPPEDPAIYCFPALDEFYASIGPKVLTPGIKWYESSVPVTHQIVRGPAGQEIPDWSWSACLFSITDVNGLAVPINVPLADLNGTDRAGLPTAARACGRPSGDGWTMWAACDAPHRSELVAYAEISLTAEEIARVSPLLPAEGTVVHGPPRLELELPEAEEQCRTLAEDYLGAPLAAHAPTLVAELTIVTPSYVYDEPVEPNGPFSEGRLSGVGAECQLIVVGDRELSGSVAGIGTGPLPLN